MKARRLTASNQTLEDTRLSWHLHRNDDERSILVLSFELAVHPGPKQRKRHVGADQPPRQSKVNNIIFQNGTINWIDDR